jgi:hypothetical protein
MILLYPCKGRIVKGFFYALHLAPEKLSHKLAEANKART